MHSEFCEFFFVGKTPSRAIQFENNEEVCNFSGNNYKNATIFNREYSAEIHKST